MIVVIPCAREVSLDYLAPLIEAGARLIVVDDSEGRSRIDHPRFQVFTWGDRRRILGDLEITIPKLNGACRDFGFYMAWRESDDDEIIVALDDDCCVSDPGFAQEVERVLGPAPRPTVQGEGQHFNILELYRDVPADLYPRGFPYSARLSHRPWAVAGESDGLVRFNLGLWRGAFDVNAIDKINGPEWHHPNAMLRN